MTRHLRRRTWSRQSITGDPANRARPYVIRLPDELRARLDAAADHAGITTAALIRKAAEDYLAGDVAVPGRDH